MITETRAAVEAVDCLLGRYSQVLDEQDWQQWPDLFADECSYKVQTLDNLERGLPLAYMFDDNRNRVLDRVKFITEVWAGTIEPYRTRHVAQRTSITAIDGSSWRVRSNFQVAFTETGLPPNMLASGYYVDVVRANEHGARFVSRDVLLDSMPARYLVYPL
ncbi:aromatic-ring-hydroxylating dioxygenase subunit beta [Rhodococcus erythropolis]|uniref:aromatic-ring-hydroxylating dioxygenase subunit beta n=1 Tax=Rhodococcus erythropolis TaxID=1833 RepID=UPI001BEBAED0|nr:aromatic-ring-hydroxylating dioxygenase subunit beta [Rhodococcus erythropolis]MBT2269000.1 nuclear transport factor 2 family protein [Rhodococcus erythropolis]